MFLPGPQDYEDLLRDPVAGDWLASYSSPKTREDYARALKVILRRTSLSPAELLKLDKKDALKRVRSIVHEYVADDRLAAARQIQTAARGFFEHYDLALAWKRTDRIKKIRKKIGIEVIPAKPQVIAMANHVKKTDSPDRIRTRAVITCLFESGVRVGCLCKWTVGLVRDQLYPKITVPVRLRITNQMDTKLSAYGLAYYYAFLQKEGAAALREYFDLRIRKEGKLDDRDLVFKPGRGFAKNEGTEPDRVLGIVKTAAKAIGLDPERVWTHTLRKSFRKVLNATVIDEDTKEALMGHRLPGSRENYFDVHDIDEVAGKYMKANFGQTTEDEAMATMNTRFLLMSDYTLKEIEALNPSSLSDEQMQELIRKKRTAAAPLMKQDVVPMRKVKKWIREGWEFVGQLPSGEAIIRRPQS